MKKYNVKVNGRLYEVELESVEEVKGSVEIKKEEAKPTQSAPIGEGKNVVAPIGGNVIKVEVKVGDEVKKGQTLLVIEAMKLENEIVAPCDGKVVSVNVNKGANVNTGDLLVVIG